MKSLVVLVIVYLVAVTGLFGQVNLDSLLVGYWPFHENASDETGNGNNGTVHGALLTTDRFGNENSAYYFDGIDDYIDCGTNSVLDITENITVCAWVKSNSYTDVVATKWKTESGWEGSWNLSLHHFSVSHDGWNPVGITANDSININEFNCIVGSYDYDNDTLRIYVNGLPSNQGKGIGGNIFASNAKLLLGARRWYANGYHESYFEGVIDEVRIYSRVLTPEEIDSLCSSEPPSFTNEFLLEKAYNYTLGQNFPNPFRSSTSIPFYAHENGVAKFRIFNALGEEVQTITKTTTKPGAYSIELDAENLPEGIYFYKMEINDFLQTRKMLIKK